jgi:hypothetical protein
MPPARASKPAQALKPGWLQQHSIDMSEKERAALLNLSMNLEAMRKRLALSDRSSYRHI